MKKTEELSQYEKLCLMLSDLEELAKEEADGHLTIMRFTTGWKVMLGTPEMTIELSPTLECDIIGGGYAQVGGLKTFESLEEAIQSVWCGPEKCSCEVKQ